LHQLIQVLAERVGTDNAIRARMALKQTLAIPPKR
jgi:hypothetical protein